MHHKRLVHYVDELASCITFIGRHGFLGRVFVAEPASTFSRGHHEIVASPCTIAPTGETLVRAIKQAVNLRMASNARYIGAV